MKLYDGIVSRKDNLENKPKWLRILIGRFRHFLKFCPNCNSDAPEKYYCGICRNGIVKTKIDLWRRFKSVNYQNATPQEDLTQKDKKEIQERIDWFKRQNKI